jgi:hypothetical protein
MARLAQALQIFLVEGIATIGDLDLMVYQDSWCYSSLSEARLTQRMIRSISPAR